MKYLGLGRKDLRQPPATVGRAAPVAQVIHFLNRPLPNKLPSKGARALLGLERGQKRLPPATVGKPDVPAQAIHFLNRPLPKGLPNKTGRALLGIEDPKMVPVLRNPHKAGEDADAVFYFPGCGSERLFSQVGLATQALLFEVGAQTVLTPGCDCPTSYENGRRENQ